MEYLEVIVCLSNGMSDHYWSIMEGSAVMTSLRCGPDFPITPLPDLPGRCQNQSLQRKSIEYREEEQAYVQGRVYVRQIGLHQRLDTPNHLKQDLDLERHRLEEKMLCGSWLGLGWGTQDDQDDNWIYNL